ncbi:MAG: cardiolipin synthase [Phycisphaerae bacterium]
MGMDFSTPIWLWIYDLLGWTARIVMVLVVIRKRRPNVALAWIALILVHPLLGGLLYLLIGDIRLDREHYGRYRQLMAAAPRTAPPAADLPVPGRFRDLIRLSQCLGSLEPTTGNDIRLVDTHSAFIEGLVADIDKAEHSVSLLYFIFWDDLTGRRIADALERAASRGVRCRLLVDAAGSRPFFRGMNARLKKCGVAVHAVLPVRPWRALLVRADLRNHRKLAVIDGRSAWTGSHNVCNDDYGNSKYGPWIDLSARITGPAVAQLSRVFEEDWFAQTGDPVPDHAPPPANSREGATVQVYRSGPAGIADSLEPFFIGAMHEAEHRIVITAPYIVPTASLLLQLRVAVLRGVRVDLIVPRRSNHPIVYAAGRGSFQELLESGVNIHLHAPGLLHSKTMLVDDSFAVIGSANFDVRSLSLNFELGLLVFDQATVAALAAVHAGYLAQSQHLTAEQWAGRGRIKRTFEDFARLFSPLL